MTQIQILIQDLFVHLAERGWDKPNPASLAKSIIIEAAELLEHFQWSEPSLEKLKADSVKLQKTKEELADVMIYCLEMAKILDLDPEVLIREKISLTAKKYPAQIVKYNHKNYWDLKRIARSKE
jgi:NTP pyrophosphatase (non-canonical NTP hydrolase)